MVDNMRKTRRRIRSTTGFNGKSDGMEVSMRLMFFKVGIDMKEWQRRRWLEVNDKIYQLTRWREWPYWMI
jgi:hypothetical protein